MKTLNKVLALGLTLSFASVASAADLTPTDLAKKEPAVAKAYQGLVKPFVAKNSWLKTFGTAGPVSNIKIENKNGYQIKGCKPHSCPEKSYVALVSKDGKKAVGAVFSNTLNDIGEAKSTQISWLGQPSASLKKKILEASLDN